MGKPSGNRLLVQLLLLFPIGAHGSVFEDLKQCLKNGKLQNEVGIAGLSTAIKTECKTSAPPIAPKIQIDIQGMAAMPSDRKNLPTRLPTKRESEEQLAAINQRRKDIEPIYRSFVTKAQRALEERSRALEGWTKGFEGSPKEMAKVAERLQSQIGGFTQPGAELKANKKKLSHAQLDWAAKIAFQGVFSNPAVLHLGGTEHFRNWIFYKTPNPESGVNRCLNQGIGIEKNPSTAIATRVASQGAAGTEQSVAVLKKLPYVNANDLKAAIADARGGIKKNKADLIDDQLDLKKKLSDPNRSKNQQIYDIQAALARGLQFYPAAMSQVLHCGTDDKSKDCAGVQPSTLAYEVCQASVRMVGQEKSDQATKDLLTYAALASLPVALLIPGAGAAAVTVVMSGTQLGHAVTDPNPT